MPDGSTLIRINNWTWGQLDVLKFRAALVSGTRFSTDHEARIYESEAGTGL
jgi:hypothetical protein